MASKPMMAKDVMVKVFSSASANALVATINEWRDSMSDNIELFSIKYAVAPREAGNTWDVYSALIVYGEGSRAFQ